MPEIDLSSLTSHLKTFTMEKALAAVLVFLVCLLVIKVVTRLTEKLLGRVKRLDPRMNRYALTALKAVLYILTALIVAQSLGIPTTSLVALFSVLSLAVSLAVQDVLGNVAGGIVILFSKPFQIGDYIETDAGGVIATTIAIITRLQGSDITMSARYEPSSIVWNAPLNDNLSINHKYRCIDTDMLIKQLSNDL